MLRLPPPSTLFPYTTLFRSGILNITGNVSVGTTATVGAIDVEAAMNVTGSLTLQAGDDITIDAVIDPATGLIQSNDNRSEEHTSELQSRQYLVCRLLLEKKK